jgi:hypothetical protein
MSISRSHDKNSRLIEGLSRLLQGYENGEERTATIGKEIYLPGETCPSGLVACDESKQECPGEEFRVEPGIYTSKGMRCYTRQGVARARELSREDKDTAVKGLRALVVEVAKLRDMNTEIDKILAPKSEAAKKIQAIARARAGRPGQRSVLESKRQAQAYEETEGRDESRKTSRRLDICDKYNKLLDDAAVVESEEDRKQFIANSIKRAEEREDENAKIAARRLDSEWRAGRGKTKLNCQDFSLSGGEYDSDMSEMMSEDSMSDDYSVY